MSNAKPSRSAAWNRAGLRAIAASLGLITVLIGGCEEKASSAQSVKSAFVDNDFGFKLTPQPMWREAPSTSVQVPGKVVKVWFFDNGSNVVAFTQEVAMAVSAEQLLRSSAAAMKAAGCRVSVEQVAKIAGKDAMSLKLSGPGTGVAFVVGGGVTTFQHWIAIPKQNRVLVLLFTAPDASKADAEKSFDAMLQTVVVD